MEEDTIEDVEEMGKEEEEGMDRRAAVVDGVEVAAANEVEDEDVVG